MMRRSSITLCFLLLTSTVLLAQTKINVSNIDIVRDEYGVPHIYSVTDAEAVYGLGWAQCEDNFNVMQENYAAAKGLAGSLLGKNGAAADFIYQSLGITEFVEKRYALDIDAHTHSLIQSYADALNRYAETHPEELRTKKLFPLSAKEIAANYVFQMLMLHKAVVELAKVLTDYKEEMSPKELRGSNVMAYGPPFTQDGKTYLVGNPHQPVTGPACFWEVAIHSKEGLEIHGATFAGGGMLPVLGATPNLGWSMTNNYQNSSDVYELEMHPSKKHTYLYDGKWLVLEKRKAELKVKLGGIIIPVTKKYYWSAYGTTYKNRSGYYGYKSNALHNLKSSEMLYRAARSKNFEEFRSAMDLQGLAALNLAYADRYGAVYQISNYIHPYRDPSFDWCSVMTGNTSQINWNSDSIHPIKDLPQLLNPKCGYVYNTNNTSFKMTCEEENLKQEDFPASFCLEKSNNVRAKTFENLVSKFDKVSFEDVRKMRESLWVDKNDLGGRNCMNCGDIPQILGKYPELANAKKVFDQWNGSSDVENRQAPIMALTTVFLGEYVFEHFLNEDKDIPEEVIKEAIVKAEKYLMKHYGTLEIPLGELQKAVKDGVELPMYGSLNTLANANFETTKSGKLHQTGGDSYIFYAKYGKGGLEQLETVNAYGNSNKPGHPHATDQTELYTTLKTKTIELDAAKFRKGRAAYNPR